MRPIQRKTGDGHRPPIFGALAKHRRAAFTITELVIVVMIMGIMAAVAAPAFLDSLLFHRVESAARRLKSDLELARHTARLTSSSQSVAFTNSTYALSAGVKDFDNPNANYVVDLGSSPYDLDGVTVDFNGAQNVSFDGFGTPTSGGTVVLTSKGHQCTLMLNAITGEVTIVGN